MQRNHRKYSHPICNVKSIYKYPTKRIYLNELAPDKKKVITSFGGAPITWPGFTRTNNAVWPHVKDKSIYSLFYISDLNGLNRPLLTMCL